MLFEEPAPTAVITLGFDERLPVAQRLERLAAAARNVC
jgi:hypothetical protein